MLNLMNFCLTGGLFSPPGSCSPAPRCSPLFPLTSPADFSLAQFSPSQSVPEDEPNTADLFKQPEEASPVILSDMKSSEHLLEGAGQVHPIIVAAKKSSGDSWQEQKGSDPIIVVEGLVSEEKSSVESLAEEREGDSMVVTC